MSIEQIISADQSVAMPRQEAGNAKAAKLAHELGKVCSIAHNMLNNPDYNQQGKKGLLIERTLRGTRTARHLLRAILPDHERLIGAGRDALVFEKPDEDTVEKRVFQNIGQAGDAEHVVSRSNSYRDLVGHFGALVVPTVFTSGDLQIRPAGTFATTVIEQPRVHEAIDIFSAEARARFAAARDTALEDDLYNLVQRTRTAQTDGCWLDVGAAGNVVVSGDSGEDRIRILDIGTYAPDKLDTPFIDGPTAKDFLLRRTEQLEDLLIASR